ncbi:FYVE, RhoGEF and PH domain-containing protein 6 isoform X2 [Amia ocellicauda]|uniref:FYVE, RhoGEF and PH domain-containing protein 6 isoform X2 n=1 Tax=Amia ocellicauda TaxID=2972642 RepID=UPI00346430E4
MSTGIKKPPVAPKPKLVQTQKPSPPPVAPKPDILSQSAPAPKKAKPAVAPKPCFPKSVLLHNSSPPSLKNTSQTLTDEKAELSENLGLLNSKNGLQTEFCKLNSNYIIPTCTCIPECGHTCQHTGNSKKTEIVIDQLEKLETWQNGRADRTEFSPVPRTNNYHKHKHQESSTARKDKADTFDPDQKLHSTGSIDTFAGKCLLPEGPQAMAYKQVKDLQANSQITLSSVCQPRNISAHSENPVCSTESGCEPREETSRDSEPLICPAAPKKPLPVPMPRKSRKCGLVRQDCIESNQLEVKDTTESTDQETDGKSVKNSPFKSPKVCIHTQSVSYSRNPGENQAHAELSHGGDSGKKSEKPDQVCGDASVGVLENMSHLADCGEVEEEDAIQPPAVSESEDAERTSSFVHAPATRSHLRFRASCNMQLTVANTLAFSEEKSHTTDINSQTERSPKVAPKKPQRHSLPASGLLKKELSEELNERSRCVGEGESGPTNQDCPQEEEQIVPVEEDLKPEPPTEKPAWRLHRPIMPFFGKPDSLKTASTRNVHAKVLSLGKPRAKSFSSADLERSESLPKEGQKRSSFRKLLEMKLSVRKLPRLLAKSSQSLDCTTVAADPPMDEYRTAAQYSPVAKTRGQVANGQCEAPITVNSKSDLVDGLKALCSQNLLEGSLYQESLPFPDLDVEYENVPHYEEIPEYMNLPFRNASGLRHSVSPPFSWNNSSSVEDAEADLYEVQEPYEPHLRYITHDLSSTYQRPTLDGDPRLENDHSEEEEMANSSDEDDNSSASSKGELDASGDRQHELGAKRTKVVHIAREIMSSEKVFVDVLKLLHIDFRDAVAKASRQSGKPVIEERTLNQILYYLPQLYELNRDLLRELEERVAHWNDHQRIADIFVKKGPYLKMYSTYIKEFDKSIALLDEQCKRNPGFAGVVREFEMSPRCANLALKHYLLKPVQRIPQYQLLLTDYLKNLHEDSSDYKDTQAALSIVIEVANHANDIMKQGDNFQKLMQIQYSLNGHHEIVQPGRVFLKEGTLMKLSRKVMQPRMFFLFNDTLLYTTPVQSGMHKLNSMLSLAGMKVSKPTQEAYQNELNIESVERSFILSASSARERDAWLQAISKAIDDYTRKKITFFASKSLEEADSVSMDSGAPLGSKAPIWIPDLRATMCMICTCEFTLTWRRHHCRACGKVVCQSCSSNKHRLDYLKNQSARVCDQCIVKLQQNDEAVPAAVSPSGKSSTGAFSSVLISIPSGRKQKKIPAALKEVSASTENSSMSGYLHRSKGHKKPWKRLWFVIKNKVLYTYAASEDVAALESQPLLGFHLKEERADQMLQFKLYHKHTLFYIFKADDAPTAQKWMEAFQEATVL